MSKKKIGKIGRNEPCSCGSGKKYKHCCYLNKSDKSVLGRLWIVLVIALVAGTVLGGILVLRNSESTTRETPVPWEYDEEHDRHWHPGHGHWHHGPPPIREDS